MKRAAIVLALLSTPGWASSIDREQVRKVMQTASPGFKRCYEQALTRDGPSAGGKARLTISVAREGAVSSVKVELPGASADFSHCLEEVASRVVFPRSPEPWSLVWPIEFKAPSP